MSGTNTGNIPINGVDDTFLEVRENVFLPTLTVSVFDQDADKRLKTVATVWSPYQTLRTDIDATGVYWLQPEIESYVLAEKEFDILVKIPESIRSDNEQLVVFVWPQVGGKTPEPLDVECIVQ